MTPEEKEAARHLESITQAGFNMEVCPDILPGEPITLQVECAECKSRLDITSVVFADGKLASLVKPCSECRKKFVGTGTKFTVDGQPIGYVSDRDNLVAAMERNPSVREAVNKMFEPTHACLACEARFEPSWGFDPKTCHLCGGDVVRINTSA